MKKLSLNKQALEINRQQTKKGRYQSGNIGSLYKNLGQYDKAIEYYKAYWDSKANRDKEEGINLETLTVYKIRTIWKCYRILQSVHWDSKANRNKRMKEFLGNLDAYKNLEYDKAIEYYKASIEIAKQIGNKENYFRK